MNARARLWFCLAAVTALYAFHVHLKLAKIAAQPTWSATDDTGQFWSEFAFHYRFAKFFAEHPVGDWAALQHDRAVQYPDEMNDWAEFTVAMEVPVGVGYRIARPLAKALALPLPPFHVWVVWYDCLVSSLTLFLVFLLAREVWRSDWAGLAASLFYAPLYPSYGRTVKNLFLREDFAVPLIACALWLTVRVLSRGAAGDRRSAEGARSGDPRTAAGRHGRDARAAIAAALAWLAALASWHLTQFVLTVFAGALVLVWLSGRLEQAGRRLRWLVAMLALGGVLLPVLRAKQFYLSPVMGVLYGLVLAEWVDGSRRKRVGVLIGTTLACVLAGLVLGKSVGEYGHVYQLFFCKLQFLGVKPADPARLPWEARCLWEAAFNTATWGEWWHSLLWCGPLGALGVWLALRQQPRSASVVNAAADKSGAATVALFTLLLVPLSWMVVRYFTFLGLLAPVMASGLVATPMLAPGRALLQRGLVVAALVWQFATLNGQPLERIQPTPAEYRPLVRWVDENTPTNAVILAHITESPVLLAHTERPIIMHSKFENQEIRDRYRQMLAAIYGDETLFYNFCRRYGADYFVYDSSYLYAGRDSRRYKADRLGELPENCAARMFAERPAGLQHFRAELSTGRFTVFRVLK